MTQVETVLGVAIGAILAVAAALTIYRITRGPSVLDRAVASDVLVSVVVCSLGAYAALVEATSTLPLLISLTLVGFLAAVAVARFVARDRDQPVEHPAPGLSQEQLRTVQEPVMRSGDEVDPR